MPHESYILEGMEQLSRRQLYRLMKAAARDALRESVKDWNRNVLDWLLRNYGWTAALGIVMLEGYAVYRLKDYL